MALFQKTDPTITIRRGLDTAIAGRNKLAARLADATTSVDAATASAQRLAINDADDSSLDRAEGIKRAAQDRAATLASALAESNTTIKKLESDLAVAVEAKTRRETVAEIAALKADFETAWADVARALARAEPITEQVSVNIQEAMPLFVYAQSSRPQIPEALSLIGRRFGDHSAAVAQGSAPATLKKPEVPAPKVAPFAAPPTQIVFCTRSVKWKNADGHIQLAGMFTDVYLPVSLVAKALASAAVVGIDHPARKTHLNTHNAHPNPATAFDLDGDEIAGTAAPILASSPFEPSDYNEKKIIQIKVAR